LATKDHAAEQDPVSLGRLRSTSRPQPALDAVHQLATSTRAAGETEQLARQQGQLIGLIADTLDQCDYRRAAAALANGLARMLGCVRVSVGAYRGRVLAVDVISDTVEFESGSSLVRRLCQAMEEACEQSDVVVFPGRSDAAQVTRMHAELVQQANGAQSVCTVPMVNAGKVVGAVLLERTQVAPFTTQEISQIEHACLLVAPILQLKRQAEDPLLIRWRDGLRSLVADILGPKHAAAKAGGVLLVAALLSMSAIVVEHRVTSSAFLEPTGVRAVVSPTRGFIARIQGHAGDVVSVGTPLAELDQRDLQLELEKHRNELSQNAKESQSALAARDRARVRVLESQEKQITAQIRLVESLIERGQLTSPIDGVIITANPDYSFGTPIERGEVLFEIAALDDYELIIQVDERDIASVHEGAPGRVVLTARPDDAVPFTVTRVIPVSMSSDGATTFRVEGALEQQPNWLRPGMSGISKIDIDERSLLWVWTHRISEEIETRWWRWGWT